MKTPTLREVVGDETAEEMIYDAGYERGRAEAGRGMLTRRQAKWAVRLAWALGAKRRELGPEAIEAVLDEAVSK